MNRFSRLDLPEDLADLLHSKISEITAAFHAPCVDLAASPGGRDILNAVNVMGPHLGSRWARFDSLLGSAVFTPRIYNYYQSGKANKGRWAPRRITIASRDLLAGNPAKLRQLFTELGAEETNNFVNFWVWPALDKGPGIFFVLARHKDGTEGAFSVAQENWQQIEASPAAVEVILADLLAPDHQMKNRWVAILGQNITRADESMRAELLPLFQQWGLTNLSEGQWMELQEAVFMRPDYLDGIVDAARHLTTPLMHEAQNLLEAVGQITASAKEDLDRRVSQLQREHARAHKRALADLSKANMSLNGAHTRNRALAKEIALLQDKARLQPASPAPIAEVAAADDASLALALDQFFT